VNVKSTVTLFFGGRGASLLTWIARDSYLESVLESAFLRGLRMDSSEAPEIKVNLFAPGISYDPSSPLKSEVVRGLLAPEIGEVGARRPETTILGEVGWRTPEGKTLGWSDEVGAAQLQTLVSPPNHDSGYIAFFLNRVLLEHADLLGLDGPGLKLLRLDPARVEDQLRRSVAKDLEVLQPVFAVELKVLLDRYMERAAQAS
jgi:hypothetical protein